VVIIETRAFTQRIDALLTPDEYRELQLELVARPLAGTVIPATGGFRKLRWAASGRGKRGGIRIIYYYAPTPDQLLLLFVFAKNERSDLSPQQRQRLRAIVESEYP
jgi:hypothetical protein